MIRLKEDNRYMANELGQIFSFVKHKEGKLLKGELIKKGYLRIHVGKKRFLVHRLIAENFLPKIEGKNFINHKDGNKTNNNINNLEWCTCTENNNHALKNGFRINKKGEEFWSAKLNEKQVRVIKHILTFKNRLTYKQIARIFNVYETVIGKIKRNEIWKHVII